MAAIVLIDHEPFLESLHLKIKSKKHLGTYTEFSYLEKVIVEDVFTGGDRPYP